MIKIINETMKGSKDRIGLNSFSVNCDTFNSYCDIASNDVFPIKIHNHSKENSLNLYMSSDIYGSIEVFDETDGGFW
ncbi:MAG: hypothetical protein DRJ01_04990 [Bacteroidetes bacterium]|nr:MAG: hypothetical protein DRJ01_04990 [Bacteroidota bacterium]